MQIEMTSAMVGAGTVIVAGAVAVVVASKYTAAGKDYNAFRKIRNLEDEDARVNRQIWWASILDAEQAKAEAEMAEKKEAAAAKKAKPATV